jgi:hypothetical protein
MTVGAGRISDKEKYLFSLLTIVGNKYTDAFMISPKITKLPALNYI